MHAAPPVSFPAGRSRVAAILLAILSGLALAAAVAWLLAVPVAGWRQGGAFAAWLAVVLIAWRGWLASATGLLRWDGAGWTWSPGADAEVSGAPTIALDLQASMLLRWLGQDGRGRWLWIDRASAPADWPALRRAVYSRARNEAPDGAKPPMAQR